MSNFKKLNNTNYSLLLACKNGLVSSIHFLTTDNISCLNEEWRKIQS